MFRATSSSAHSANNLLQNFSLSCIASNNLDRVRKGLKVGSSLLFLCLVLLAIVPQAFGDLQSGEISNVQVSNIQINQATFTWTTLHPGSSWVLLDFWNPGGELPGRKVGQNESVTNHSVTVVGLVPFDPTAGSGDVGHYSYYVATQRTDDGSWASWGGPDTNHYYTVQAFQTTTLDTSAPLAVRMVPLGQQHVYAGHDLYAEPTISLLGGGAGLQQETIGVMNSNQVLDSGNNDVHWQVDMLDSLRAYPEGFNPPPTWDGRIFKLTSGPNPARNTFSAWVSRTGQQPRR